MDEATLEKYNKLTEKALNAIIELETNPPEFILDESIPLDVFSDAEIQKREADFIRSFYIDPEKLSFKSISITNTPFLAMSTEQQNMGICVRVTDAISNSGENLINPNSIKSNVKFSTYYINHDAGYAGDMSCQPTPVYLNHENYFDNVSYVKGEVRVEYNPGYDVLPIKVENVGKEETFEELSYTISKYEKNYLQLTCTPENTIGYKIKAYNADNQRIKGTWVRYPVFKDDKISPDFSLDSLPTESESEIIKYIYTFTFYGPIERAELYIKKLEVAKWVPFTTPAILKGENWDDFKSIGFGPSNATTKPNFPKENDQSIIDLINCKYTLCDSLMEAGEPEISVILPDTLNVQLSNFNFENVFFTDNDGEFKSVDFNYSSNCIIDFTFEDKDYDENEVAIVPGKTCFKGKVIVDYPSHIEWVMFSKKQPEHDGHKIIFNGGLIEYLIPNSYNPIEFNNLIPGTILRCFDKDMNLLCISKIGDFSNNKLKVGVWGDVTFVEVAICKKWLKIKKDFSLLINENLESVKYIDLTEDTNPRTLTLTDVVFDRSTGTISQYLNIFRYIIIPETLDGVAVKAIYNGEWDEGNDGVFANKQLMSVVLPTSLELIGALSFKNNNLISVNVPEGVTVIGDNAFSGNKLRHVTIPNSVNVIDDYAFEGNELASVTLSNAISALSMGVFEDNELSHVTIPDSVLSIESNAFSDNQLTSVNLPSSLNNICEMAFADNQLTSIIIPNSVHTIGEGAFSSNSLTSVTIPDSVTSIGEFAFWTNNLTSLTLPNSLTILAEAVFCDNELTNIVIPNSVTSIADSAFRRNELTHIVIPNSVTAIGTGGFEGNELTTVTIPSSVTMLADDAFESDVEIMRS